MRFVFRLTTTTSTLLHQVCSVDLLNSIEIEFYTKLLYKKPIKVPNCLETFMREFQMNLF